MTRSAAPSHASSVASAVARSAQRAIIDSGSSSARTARSRTGPSARTVAADVRPEEAPTPSPGPSTSSASRRPSSRTASTSSAPRSTTRVGGQGSPWRTTTVPGRTASPRGSGFVCTGQSLRHGRAPSGGAAPYMSPPTLGGHPWPARSEAGDAPGSPDRIGLPEPRDDDTAPRRNPRGEAEAEARARAGGGPVVRRAVETPSEEGRIARGDGELHGGRLDREGRATRRQLLCGAHRPGQDHGEGQDGAPRASRATTSARSRCSTAASAPRRSRPRRR